MFTESVQGTEWRGLSSVNWGEQVPIVCYSITGGAGGDMIQEPLVFFTFRVGSVFLKYVTSCSNFILRVSLQI